MIMSLLLLENNMRSFMYGVSLGFIVLTLEAAGNGISRLAFNQSINNWVDSKLSGSQGGN